MISMNDYKYYYPESRLKVNFLLNVSLCLNDYKKFQNSGAGSLTTESLRNNHCWRFNTVNIIILYVYKYAKYKVYKF